MDIQQNAIGDLFFPKFCSLDPKVRGFKVESEVPKHSYSNELNCEDIGRCFCSHSSKCEICKDLKDLLQGTAEDKIKIHKLVKESGKYNFECCKIVVNKQIDTDFMRRMLRDYRDMQVLEFLKYGFPIGFEGDRLSNIQGDLKQNCKNHKGAEDFPDDINKYIKKEASHNAIIGPFRENPFEDELLVAPLNSVPKSTPGERRVILDLSFSKNGNAVNDSVPKDYYLGDEVSLKFPKVDDFVALIKSKGRGCLLYKLDLRRAYRQISICPSDYSLVAYSWKKHIFCDAVLPMGLRSSAFICQRVTSAFAYMMLMIGFAVLNYLDDFAGAERGQQAMVAFLMLRELLKRSGIEEALDKACPPSEVMIFLGILFNTITMTVEITPDRLIEIKNLVERWLGKERASLREIQGLLGKLNFVCCCVHPSRVFVNRILNWLRCCYGHKQREYDVPEEVKKDLLWWSKFMPVYNGISMMDYGEWYEADSVFSSDACLTGCGGISGKVYFHSVFPSFIEDLRLHISALEFLSVVVCLKVWGDRLKGKKLLIACDNLATCIVINTGKSKCKFMQQCLREVCFLAAVHEFRIKAQHIDGKSNRIADCLSRWHLDGSHRVEFWRLTGDIDDIQELSVGEDSFRFSHNW